MAISSLVGHSYLKYFLYPELEPFPLLETNLLGTYNQGATFP